MIWLIIFVPWMFVALWYICTILSPNCFDRISNKTIEKQSIMQGTFLEKVYLNKTAFPKLKIVAILFIIFCIMTVLCNCCDILVYLVFDLINVSRAISICNTMLILITGGVVIFCLNLIK